MNIQASSCSRKLDVRDHCGRLVLRAQHDGEARALAALYMAFVEGKISSVALERWAKKKKRAASASPAGEAAETKEESDAG